MTARGAVTRVAKDTWGRLQNRVWRSRCWTSFLSDYDLLQHALNLVSSMRGMIAFVRVAVRGMIAS
jgi:hypothetical protein